MSLPNAHGPWCDDPSDEPCSSCQPIRVSVNTGIWLLARLWAHHTYNRGIPRLKQQPLLGLMLGDADWLEISKLRLELHRGAGPESVR